MLQNLFTQQSQRSQCAIIFAFKVAPLILDMLLMMDIIVFTHKIL